MVMSQRTWKMRVESNVENRLSAADKAYFRMRTKGKVYDAMMKRFMAMRGVGLTKAQLSRKLGCRPEQVTRWLSTPGNMTLESLSDLLLAMGAEAEIRVISLGELMPSAEAGIPKAPYNLDPVSSTSATKEVTLRNKAA